VSRLRLHSPANIQRAALTLANLQTLRIRCHSAKTRKSSPPQGESLN